MRVDFQHIGGRFVLSDRSLTNGLRVRRRYVRDAAWPISPRARKPGEPFLVAMAKSPVRAALWSIRSITAPLEARRLQCVSARGDGVDLQGVSVVKEGSGRGLEQCDIRYINLDSRLDRRAAFEHEMEKIGVSWHARVSAVSANPGALGCGLSHINVLREWGATPGRLLLVCEDDAEFIAPRTDLDALIREFASMPKLKVLALAHRTAWHIPITKRLAISSDIQTTAAYVVKPESIGELVEAFDGSVRRLRLGVSARRAAIDIAWKRMQREHLFAIPTRTCVIQRAGYSDIQRSQVNYYRQ